MTSRLTNQVLMVALVAALSWQASSQGTFQNLDFESATLVPIPGDPFGRVQFGPGFPGWTGYIGDEPQTIVDHNSRLISQPGIAIMGPDFPSANLFQGHYFAELYTTPGVLVSPALAQTGTVPTTAQSIRFYGGAQDVPFILFAGQSIPLSVLGSTATYTIWGGDISAFAGQLGELRFQGSRRFDNISFSDLAIPEPSAFGLFALGGLLLGWQLRRIKP